MARHILLLFFSGIAFFSASADLLASIDCGSSELTYTDENLIVWVGDSDYISNGLSETAQTSSSISHVMETLRVFTSRKKNCYTVQLDQGAGERILARASFYYGNYDQKSSPPSFDLQFDGNAWATVQTSVDQVVYYEVTYVAKGDFTSICLAQTNPGQFPFINALEIRSFDDTMYNHVDDNHALILSRRFAYGTNQTIRYSDDPYDRIWSPSAGGNGLIAETSDALLINSLGADNPPQAVLQDAITVANVSMVIQLGAVFPATEVPVYMNLYFSEVTQLDSTQSRSFTLFKDNQSISDPILPPYSNFIEAYFPNITASSDTKFYLVATPNSTLPPLINAMEVFFISDPLTNGTNSIDVAGLALLQKAFDVLQDWGGDPCLPAPYTWDWVNCSSDATPRVTALYLSGYSLSGPLPDISSMDSLQTIDLHNNSLRGPIPDSLGSLPNLKQLNLADNEFSGPVPASLSKKNNLNLVITGNPNLCTSGKSCKSTPTAASGSPGNLAGGSSKKSSSKLPVILGITIPVFVLIWAVVGVLAILHYRRKRAAVAAVIAGQNGGANAPNGSGVNAEEIGKIGMAILNAYARNEAVNNSPDNANSRTNQTA